MERAEKRAGESVAGGWQTKINKRRKRCSRTKGSNIPVFNPLLGTRSRRLVELDGELIAAVVNKPLLPRKHRGLRRLSS